MRLVVVVAAFLAVAALASDAAAQHPMRPGRWEITMQMAMPNMPMQMPAVKSTQCITQAQLDAPDKGLPTGPAGRGYRDLEDRVLRSAGDDWVRRVTVHRGHIRGRDADGHGSAADDHEIQREAPRRLRALAPPGVSRCAC
jgi:hypothetical protein